MSYRCEVCTDPQPDGATPIIMVAETRRREYNNESTTVGWEIVREKKVCPPCAAEIEDVAETLRTKLKPHLHKAINENEVEALTHTAMEGLRDVYSAV